MRTLSLCTCCRHYPGAAAGRSLRPSHPAVSAFPERVVGSACTSSFSRLARRSLALRPAHSRRHLYVTCYTEGFSHIVTSMTAPVASGWSGCRVGLAPTGTRRLFTAHTRSGHSADSHGHALRLTRNISGCGRVGGVFAVRKHCGGAAHAHPASAPAASNRSSHDCGRCREAARTSSLAPRQPRLTAVQPVRIALARAEGLARLGADSA